MKPHHTLRDLQPIIRVTGLPQAFFCLTKNHPISDLVVFHVFVYIFFNCFADFCPISSLAEEQKTRPELASENRLEKLA